MSLIFQVRRARRRPQRSMSTTVNDGLTTAGGAGATELDNNPNGSGGETAAMLATKENNGASSSSNGTKNFSITLPGRRQPGGKNNNENGGKRCSNVNRRRMEDNLAMIFMGIVAVFLLCHFPRVFLGLHEMFIVKESLACAEIANSLRIANPGQRPSVQVRI